MTFFLFIDDVAIKLLHVRPFIGHTRGTIFLVGEGWRLIYLFSSEYLRA